MFRRIRRKLRNVHSLRSAFHFCLALMARVQWAKPALEASLNELYEKPDPWEYTTSPEQQDRFDSAVRLLDKIRGGTLFEHAFEVGCAEGAFTVLLAPRCASLLAVDVLTKPLDRARSRCAGINVVFETWDLMLSPVPAHMDLVVAMDVLEFYFRPSHVRTARDKLVSAVRPGGYLLLGNSRQNQIFESARWGKWMVRGGQRIAECFAEHPRLRLVAAETGDFYVNALFVARA